MIVSVHYGWVSSNSPKPRVTKQNGLWNAYRFGEWIGATSNWETAQEAAVTGVWRMR